MIIICIYCVCKTLQHARQQTQQEMNFYYTDSIQKVHASHRYGGAESATLGGSTVPAVHTWSTSMRSDKSIAERSCDDLSGEQSDHLLLPHHTTQHNQHPPPAAVAANQAVVDPQYFVLDRDYMDRQTLQIR